MKIAVLFPGIGYTCDRPLLYYSGKSAAHYQYEVIKVSYANLAKSIPKAFASGCARTELVLEEIDWGQYEDILFISKSIGTAIAAAYAQKHGISCRNVYFTPLLQTFDYAPQFGPVFHGTCDTRAETAAIRQKCQELSLPLYLVENASHSLELQPPNTPSSQPARSCLLQNLHILETSMALTEQYIADGVYYRALRADEICRGLFQDFVRHQDVVKCWRRDNGKWVIRDDPFTDDWTEEDYHFLVRCLQNTVRTGGFVYAAFCGHPSCSTLKGFVSVEPALFGGAQGYLDLSSIHVSEDMRGKGIGSSLFRAAREWAKRKGGRKLYISAHSAVETQAFYRAMGCVEAQEYDRHHVEQEPFDCQLECAL